MTRFTTIVLSALAVASNAVNGQYNGGSYEPPAVQQAAAAMAEAYKQYIGYAPSVTAAAVAAGPSVDALRKTKTSTSSSATPASTACSYWLDEIKHQGVAAFNSNTNYTVYRNVKDYGAVGDGITDDTAAIQAAIADSGRPSITTGQSFTNMPAVVYIPQGTYLISTSIIDYYYTQIIGNPNCMPTLLASPAFSAGPGNIGMIEGDPYTSANLGFGATDIFYRQIRNIVFDMTMVPTGGAVTGVHWPTAQATSIQNCVFRMSDAPGVAAQGIFLESGSAGFMTDLVFTGGLYGMNVGNQQYTMRNISFSNAVTGFSLFFDWGWTMHGLTINNCSVGVDISASPADQSDHAFLIVDSSISNTPLAVKTSFNATANNPPTGGTLILENVKLNNVTTAVNGAGGTTLLAGGTKTIAAYAQGHRYNPTGPQIIHGTIPANPRPGVLTTSSGSYYTQSKPQYANIPASQFVSARTSGAKGNGIHDDTAPLQKALNATAAAGQILFVDAGTYLVTKTLYVPPGARIVGESYSVIMSSGAYFNDVKNPRAVVQIGAPGERGRVEWSDMIVSTQGGNTGQMGAILIEWNLAAPAATPSGMWDVHTRLGGFIGSNFEGATCPTTPSSPKTNKQQLEGKCYAAYMSIWITESAQGVYLENNWFWTADHDLDNNDGGNQITVYTGRGMLVDNSAGPIWLWGTAVEHHALYQYQFIGASNVFAGQMQTETAYWQPNPNATVPFTANPQIYDPVFPTTPFNASDLPGVSIPNADGWGLRAVNSTLLIYGAGLYSFFNNYSTACSNQPNLPNGGNETCQSRIMSVEGSSIVYLYDLHTVGAHEQITLNGVDVALYSDNLDDFTDNIAVFRNKGN